MFKISTLNTLPFPQNNGVYYYNNADLEGYLTMPIEQYIRVNNLFVPVNTINPLPVNNFSSILANETNKVVTANTDILIDYTANKTAMTILMIATNTDGILKLEVDGSLNTLNDGFILSVDNWYIFNICLLVDSVYNLQFSENTTMQIKWIG